MENIFFTLYFVIQSTLYLKIKTTYPLQFKTIIFKEKYFRKLETAFLWIFWVIFFRDVFAWFFWVYLELFDVLNLILILGVIILTFLRNKNQHIFSWKTFYFRFRILPFLLFCFSSIAYLLVEYFYHINIVQASLFALATYGLLGLYLPYRLWLKALIPSILLIQTLPFGGLLDVYVGFPLRMSMSETVANLLNQLNIENISAQTIITIENRAVQVDLTCSGLKGLWSACLFFFALTWLEKPKINWKWFLLLPLLFALVYLFNLSRVIILVLLDFVFLKPDLADFLHVPLGIIGFIITCVSLYFLILKLPKSPDNSVKFTQFSQIKKRKNPRFQWIIIFIIACFSMAYTPHPRKEPSQTMESLHFIFPEEIQTQKIPLTENECKYFKNENSLAEKYNFQFKEISGSILIVKSSTWRGHHPPEICLESNGFEIKKSETKLIQENFPVKFLHLKDNISGCYWFQSENEITEDFSARVWSELQGKSKNWFLYSIVFNQEVDDLKEFVKILVISDEI